jgi:phage anti-repressor protein
MIKKFTRKQLQEQLGFNAEKTQLILEYQKRLPILLEDNDTWVDARKLHEQLGVGRDFSTWIKQQIEDMYLEEFIDYIIDSPSKGKTSPVGGRPTIDYNIKISTAKEIAMVSGIKGGRTSHKLKENSKIARKYFIYMEEAIINNIKWEETRNPEKEGFNRMCKALDDYLVKTQNRNIDKWDRIYESNSINMICTGMIASEIRHYLDCKDKITRDSLNKTYNEYIRSLQEQNIAYLNMGYNRYQRHVMLSKYFEAMFPNAKQLVDDSDIKDIIENKRKYVEELKSKTNDSTLPFGMSA